MLDADGGGSVRLAPAGPFRASRRYRPDTNVLETTYTTAEGTVRVTDAMSWPSAHTLLWNQVIRRVDGLDGAVRMTWSAEPRFDYAARSGRVARVNGMPLVVDGDSTIAIEAFDVGRPEGTGTGWTGSFTTAAGSVGVLAISCFDAEPLTFSSRDAILTRLEETAERWQRRVGRCEYDGPWREAVRRSALALDLLIDGTNGAIAAAATMGLPERVGGPRNYDYRYAWLRDGNLTLEAMQRLGFGDEVHTSLGWILKTIRRTRPRLRPMYRLDGEVRLPDAELPLPGYRGSRPVLLGNGAQDQLQLGNFGDVFDMTFNYVRSGNAIGASDGVELAGVADHLCRTWHLQDAGIWELGQREDYTESKLACWLALDRAVALADDGHLPDRSASRWRDERDRIAEFVHTRCWSDELGAYGRAAGSDELDAAVLLAARGSFFEDQPERFSATIDVIRDRLGAGGPLLYRYTWMEDEEGAFVACSFWAAEALMRVGRRDEAAEMMDALVALTNDVGLLSEEVDPRTGDFLGNLPQALSHLALVNAAHTFDRLSR